MTLGGVLHDSKKTGGRDDWGTPPEFFSRLNQKFSLDACASDWNAKCEDYYSLERGQCGLSLPWKSWTWCNPPYSQIKLWYAKALSEARDFGNSSVVLTFARTDTVAFHQYAKRATKMIFLQGRIRFIDPATREPGHAAPAPSVLVFFDAERLGQKLDVYFAKI